MAQFQAQQAASDVSKSSLLPQIGAFAEGNHIDFDAKNGPGDSYKSLEYGVRLTQPIFVSDAGFGYEASQFRTEAPQAQNNLAQQQLILDLATANFKVLRPQDTVTTAAVTE